MQHIIKLHDTVLTVCDNPDHWVDTHTNSEGFITATTYPCVTPDELTITPHDTEPEPEHNNLSSHPMCPDCGERAYSLIITTKTDFIAKYNCKCNKTFGHKHTGEKHTHCPYCADNGNKCGYCLNNFS